MYPSILGREPFENSTPPSASPTVGANCRGFVTADVRRLRFEAIAEAVDSKGLVETRDMSLPRFGTSGRVKAYVMLVLY